MSRPEALRQLALPVGLMLALSLSATAATIHVDDNAPSDPGPGDPLVSDPAEDGSAAHPYDALVEAVAAAQVGDTVLLRDGLYQGSGNFGVLVNKAITIRSENGPEGCLIELGGNGNAFTLFGTPEIRGLTMRNGSNFAGGILSIVAGAAPTIAQCVLRAGFASNGGAVYCENAAPVFRNCMFLSNNASNGGAVCVRLASAPNYFNCTFTGNTGLFGGAFFAADSSQTEIGNSILWDNHAAGIGHELYIDLNTGGLSVSVASSDVEGGMAGAFVGAGAALNWAGSNIDQDPGFAFPVTDPHLLDGSPCIDQGDAFLLGGETEDVEGDPRVAGLAVDMGADEFRPRFYFNGDKGPGQFVVLNAVGAPSGGLVMLFVSEGLLTAPIQTGLGPWHLDFPLVPGFPTVIGVLPANGHLSLSTQIPAAVPNGTTVYTQAVVGSVLSRTEVLLVE